MERIPTSHSMAASRPSPSEGGRPPERRSSPYLRRRLWLKIAPLLVGLCVLFVSATPAFALTTVTLLSPNFGPTAGGNTVTITGTGLTGTTAVQFGIGNFGTGIVVGSDTSLTVVAPAGPAGVVSVYVTSPSGTSAGTPYTYNAPALPVVTGVSPNFGPPAGGTGVTITGANFTGVLGVSFGVNPAASFFFVNANTITATSPAGAGVVDVRVTTNLGPSAITVADQFSYNGVASGLPVVSGVSPNFGPTTGGTQVYISGTNFLGATSVWFGNTPAASFSVQSNVSIIAYSPVHITALVQVSVGNGFGTSIDSYLDDFTFGSSCQYGNVNCCAYGVYGNQCCQGGVYGNQCVPCQPGYSYPYPYGCVPNSYISISSLTPPSGPIGGGNTVIIYGSGFLGVTSVTFGGATAYFTVNSDTQITATAPPANGPGTANVVVTNPNGCNVYYGGCSGYNATQATATYTYGGYGGTAPVITGINPSTGPVTGGTSVIITGYGFTSATSVLFGNTSAQFTVNSDSQITATSPAYASPGTVNVQVVNAFSSSATGNSIFRYTGSSSSVPSVTGVSPNSGPTTGGTSVTVTGSGFSGATNVWFGATAAQFTIVNDTRITAISPSHAAGLVGVAVGNAAGTSANTDLDDFTYGSNAQPNFCPLIPLWVNDLAYGSPAGGFYWDPMSQQVWTAQRSWHFFSPQPFHPALPLWADALTYGSAGGGFWWDPVSGLVWTQERSWHQYNPQGCIPR